MYGARARIGLIVPASNTVCEPEAARLCPGGVNVYATRIMFEPTIEGLNLMKKDVGRASRELGSENVCNLIAFCCTVGSMIGGLEYDLQLCREIESISGAAAITTATAVKAAFTALKVEKMTLVTPYTREINEVEKEMLEKSGLTVSSLAGYHENTDPREFTNEMIGRLSPEIAYRLALETDTPRAEVIFISCTNFACLDIIDRLETHARKPVITSNQVTMWWALRTLGLKDRLPGFGRLLAEH